MSTTLVEPKPPKHEQHAPPREATPSHGDAPPHETSHGHEPPPGHGDTPGHGGGGGHGDHKPHKKHKEHPHDAPPGVPPWLMSFGDMMTLFLCFFIMLVTMAAKQDAGLVARGLGPFVSALESHGLDGAISGEQRLQAINTFRERFGLPPEVDSTSVEAQTTFKDLGQIEDLVFKALKPHAEISQPSVAVFDPGSAQLSAAARKYLDRLAETLRPQFGALLVLDGHGVNGNGALDVNAAALSLARAAEVRRYLLEEHGFLPGRVETRAWPVELDTDAPINSVTARLLAPTPSASK